MAIRYNNIWHGSEEQITSDTYNGRTPNYSDFEEDFFKDSSFVTICNKRIINSLKLYKVKYRDLDEEVYILWGPLKNSGIRNNDNKRIQVYNSTPAIPPKTPCIAIGSYNTGDSMIHVGILEGINTFINDARYGGTYSSLWVDYYNIKYIYRFGTKSWHDGTYRKVVGCKHTDMCFLHDAIIRIFK